MLKVSVETENSYVRNLELPNKGGIEMDTHWSILSWKSQWKDTW